MNEKIKPCIVDGVFVVGYDRVKTDADCVFLIPEQIGGDDTNRSTFCLINGYDFPESGCKCRKTRAELMGMVEE